MPTCGLEPSVAGGDLRFRLRVVLAAATVEVTGVSSGGGPEVGNEFSVKHREKPSLMPKAVRREPVTHVSGPVDDLVAQVDTG